ncbi:MAG: bifunctional aminoglycoside phosphotransferase/ATP-binding protein [Acidimicrobiia bacterium]
MGDAAIHETHISIVVLIGDQAVKLKKPVRYPFIDLSTRALREQACRREVELNRRLAPDVYLGVADVVGPDGAVCDHLVVMRRMPDARRLSTLVVEHAAGNDDMVHVARRLAAFHAGAETSPTIAAAGRRDALRARWEAGFAEIQPFVGTVLDPEVESEIERLVLAYLEGREPLFRSRIDAGKVVDGHGDLLADDIFMLSDGPRILDCLEFDDQLRYGDVLADVAFLAMDLERLGAAKLAAEFLASYRELTGETHPVSLEHHYIALRAHVRAKVACLRGDAGSAEEARVLLGIALAHVRRARVVLTLVGGDAGAGKSTLAAGIAERTGWTTLRSDVVRKDLAGVGHTDRMASDFGEGIYSDEATAATYEALISRARLLLEHGQSVVLDATWGDARERASAAALAAATSSDLVELRCDAPVGIREQRIARRQRSGSDASDASVEVARALASRADPWPDAVAVDTSNRADESLSTALHAIESCGE